MLDQVVDRSCLWVQCGSSKKGTAVADVAGRPKWPRGTGWYRVAPGARVDSQVGTRLACAMYTVWTEMYAACRSPIGHANIIGHVA